MATLALLVIAGRAGAIFTRTAGARIITMATLARGALVIVAVMLVVSVAVVEVIHVIVMNNSLVATLRAVSVMMCLGGTMLSGDSHGRAPSCG